MRATLAKIFDTIHMAGGQARFVGGCVRDYLHLDCNEEDFFDFFARTNVDLDIATTLQPEHTQKLFNSKTTLATNIVVLEGIKAEITTLRHDVKCYGRAVEWEYTDSFEQDAMRRDFTINALYMDFDGKIYDYTDGLSDLKHGIVKFIGNPRQRIKEDYLRILRFLRFSCRFAKQLDIQSLQQCSELVSGMSILPKERLSAEVLKTITLPQFSTFASQISLVTCLDGRSLIENIFKNTKFDFHATQIYDKYKKDLTNVEDINFCLLYAFLQGNINEVVIMTKRYKRIISSINSLSDNLTSGEIIWLKYKYSDCYQQALTIKILQGKITNIDCLAPLTPQQARKIKAIQDDILGNSNIQGRYIKKAIKSKILHLDVL